MEILRQYQSDIMLVLSGICACIVLFVCMTNTITKKRKLTLLTIEISAMLLMICDRRAYIFRGDTSEFGWWMVRISNFFVFILTLVVILGFNQYLIDLYTREGGLERPPKRLKAANVLLLAGMAMVVISQFTGFYYTFDEMNRYQRAPGFIICYVIPLLVLVLEISVILQYRKRLRSGISISLLLFTGLSIIASVLQVFMYGISLNNMTIVAVAELLYVFALKDMTRELDNARKLEIEHYKEQHKKEHSLFEQTAESLATAIDAKDKYTHGHSTRVAMYSTQIAREAGKSEEECEKVYFAALLHDVGKIGVPDAIINKDGKLTNDEFAQIKLHPVYGNQILSTIYMSPYLSIGAHYHHERYDGRGYPEGLKGDDIPDIARIIAVADAYDAMTSKRSYRDTIPQQHVREELLKGMGTQFDPQYARIMLRLIDLDTDYRMREQMEENDDSFITRIHCDSIYNDCSLGIPVINKMVRIKLYSSPIAGFPAEESLPTILLFDALDARVHVEEYKQEELQYLEYGRFRFDGKVDIGAARKVETSVTTRDTEDDAPLKRYTIYNIEAVRVEDHAIIRPSDRQRTYQSIIALPDSARFSYISLTGEHCEIRDIHVDTEDVPVADDYIPRIAEEISYIKGCPEGDVPNVQVNRWRSNVTQGIPIKDHMKLVFHTQSLPTSRLIWHCPYVSVFTSRDGTAQGEGYREYLLLRLDGESWYSDEHAANLVECARTGAFAGWNVWKEKNREGFDCQVDIQREGNIITMATDNLGVHVSSVTTVKDEVDEIYVALTGDQCALTNIRVLPETAPHDGASQGDEGKPSA